MNEWRRMRPVLLFKSKFMQDMKSQKSPFFGKEIIMINNCFSISLEKKPFQKSNSVDQKETWIFKKLKTNSLPPLSSLYFPSSRKKSFLGC